MSRGRLALALAGLVVLFAAAIAVKELRDDDARPPEGRGPYGPTPAEGETRRGDPRPNIVLVVTDDQEVPTLRYMPKTRALIAREGVEFTDAQATFPLCCPARATLLTGQYAHNHRVLGNSAPAGGWQAFNRSGAEAKALPVAMQRAGYNTAFVGRYLNGWGIGRENPEAAAQPVPPGWSYFAGLVGLSAYSMWGYTLDVDGSDRRYPTDQADAAAYQTDVLADLAERQVERWAPEPRPFMLDVWVTAPHTEENEEVKRGRIRPAPRHRQLHANEPLLKTPSFNEADNSDKPPYVRQRRRFNSVEVQRLVRENRLRIQSLASVDDLVGRLGDALRAGGELDNTMLVFTSDNGFLQGQHRIFHGKIVPYGDSARVPLLVRGPGFERGASIDALVGNVDLVPTLLQVAGAKPLIEPDGASLVPLLEGGEGSVRGDVLLENLEPDSAQPEDGGVPEKYKRYTALRTPRWLYVVYEDTAQGAELYDLRRDPDNLDNLAGRPRYAATEKELAARLAELEDCAGAGCR